MAAAVPLWGKSGSGTEKCARLLVEGGVPGAFNDLTGCNGAGFVHPDPHRDVTLFLLAKRR